MQLDLTNLQIDNIATALQFLRAMSEATLQEVSRQVQEQLSAQASAQQAAPAQAPADPPPAQQG